MKTQEQLQDERWREILDRVQDFETELYGASFDTPAEEVRDLHDKAWRLFEEVLDRYDLRYFNPDEPVAIPVKDWDLPGCGPNAIPLSNGDDGLRTSKEEEAELAADANLLPSDLYWARLRIQQARDILEEGWQSGLEEPPVEAT